MTLLTTNVLMQPSLRSTGPRRNFLVVRNPIAGLAASRLTEEVEARLLSGGARVAHYDAEQVVSLPGLGDRIANVDAVVAAGGDGTIRALAPLLSGSKMPLGIIPAGTGNVMANEVCVPRDSAAIAHMLVAGPAIEIEGAWANGTPFYLMAGAGLDGAIVARLDVALKRRLGKIAYVRPVLSVLSRRLTAFDVVVDGVAHEACWVVAANARHYAGRFVIAPAASLTTRGLHAVLLAPRGPVAVAAALAALAAGRHDRVRDLVIVPAERIEIPEPQPAEADGDYLGCAPLVVTGGGPRFSLIVPAQS